MKKEYEKPQLIVVALEKDLLEVINPGSPTDDFTKENNLEFEEEPETGSSPHSLWEE